MRGPWIAFLVVVLGLLARPVQAQGLTGSARFGLGFGGRLADAPTEQVVGLALRGDALASVRRAPRLRLGPALELRGASAEAGFRSFEAAAGVAVVGAFGEDVALSSSTLFGGAYRADRPSTPQLVQVLALGFRDWKERPRYASSLSLFVALHAALGEAPFYEVTGGVEVDFLFLGTPFILLRDKVRAHRAE